MPASFLAAMSGGKEFSPKMKLCSIINFNEENELMSDVLIREYFYEALNKLPMSNVRLAAEDSLLEFGIKGTVDLTKYSLTEEEILMVQAIIREPMSSIQAANERYKRAVENGRKGGLKGGKIAGRGRPKKQESDGLA